MKLNSPEYKGGEYMGLLVAGSRQTLSGAIYEGGKKESVFTEEELHDKP